MPNKKEEHFSIFSFKGCLLVFVVFFVLIGIGAGITLAKIGIVDIPILSKAVYRPAQPSRKVATLNKDVVIEEILQEKIAPLKLKQSTTKITLSEAEATSLLSSQISNIKSDEVSIKSAQIVFLDDAIEVFVEISEPKESVAKIIIEPHLSNGEIDIKIRDIEIGGFNLPSFIPNLAISTLLEQKISELEKELSKSPIKEIQIVDGEISIIVDQSMMLDYK
jgi:hypothetical protein